MTAGPIYCIVDLHAISVPYDPDELARARPRHHRDPAGGRARPGALHPLSSVRRPRAHRALLAALGGHRARRPQPHAPVQGQVGAPARAGLGGALLLPGAAGRRRARLQGDRGPGRRGPAPARRADARDRAPLQRALRRGPAPATARCWSSPSTGSPRSGRGSWTCRTRARRCRPRAAREAGTVLRARRARGGAQEGDERGHRLGRRGAPRRGQGGDREPDRDPLGRPRGRAGGDRGRVRGLGLRRLQARGRRGSRSPTWRRCASATLELRGDEARARGAARRGRREGARDRLADRRRGARGDGRRARSSRLSTDDEPPSSISTSTSSRGPSTC